MGNGSCDGQTSFNSALYSYEKKRKPRWSVRGSRVSSPDEGGNRGIRRLRTKRVRAGLAPATSRDGINRSSARRLERWVFKREGKKKKLDWRH